MYQSISSDTFNDELIFISTQTVENGNLSPRIDKITASSFDADQTRRNILVTQPNDSAHLTYLTSGVKISSKEQQEFLLVNFNVGGSKADTWRFIFTDV